MADPLGVLTEQPACPVRRARPVRIPDAVACLGRRQLGLVSRAQCLRAGMSRDGIGRLLAGGEWRIVISGVIQVDPLAVTAQDWPNLARRRALVAHLRGGDDCVLVGLAALVMADVHGAPLHYIPEFSLRRGGRLQPVAGVRERRFVPRDLPTGHDKLVEIDGVTAAGPFWALLQGLPGLGREPAVSLLDSALRLELVRPGDLELLQESLAGTRGVRSLRPWFALVDPRSESPLETGARLRCRDDGCPPDDLQTVVLDGAGRFVARCDLTWDLGAGRLLIIEMDGAHHRRLGGILKDNARDLALTALGHVIYHLEWRHIADGTLTAVVMTELDRRRRATSGAAGR